MRPNDKDNKRSISAVNDKFKKWQDKSKKKSHAAHNIRVQQKQQLTEATKEEMYARKERTLDNEHMKEFLREKDKDKDKDKDKKKTYTFSNISKGAT